MKNPPDQWHTWTSRRQMHSSWSLSGRGQWKGSQQPGMARNQVDWAPGSVWVIESLRLRSARNLGFTDDWKILIRSRKSTNRQVYSQWIYQSLNLQCHFSANSRIKLWFCKNTFASCIPFKKKTKNPTYKRRCEALLGNNELMRGPVLNLESRWECDHVRVSVSSTARSHVNANNVDVIWSGIWGADSQATDPSPLCQGQLVTKLGENSNKVRSPNMHIYQTLAYPQVIAS